MGRWCRIGVANFLALHREAEELRQGCSNRAEIALGTTNGRRAPIATAGSALHRTQIAGREITARPSAKASRICVSRTTSALGAGGAAAAVGAGLFKLLISLITRNNTNAIMMKLTATVMKFP